MITEITASARPNGLNEEGDAAMNASNTACRLDSTRAGEDYFDWLRHASSLLAVLLALGVAACTNPLEVENPNKLTEEDVSQPSAMSSLTNGALASVTRGIQAIGGVYLTGSDEITWIGSRDAWNQLDQGKVDDPVNEFADAAFPFVAEGRFMADRAISEGERFRSEGELRNPLELARAYLAGALIYTSIAEQFDDFVLPEDPQEPAPPVGESNMSQLFDTAIGYATSGLEIARAAGDTELEARLLAMRARAKHSKAIWNELNPPLSSQVDPAAPLLAEAPGAAEDARQVLALVADTWRFRLDMRTELVVGDLSFALQVNQRGEIIFGDQYVDRDPEDPTTVTEIVIRDPIDDVPDPVVTAKIDEFQAGGELAGMTMSSAREMHLIAAESELAQNGDTPTFRSHINAVRSLDGLEAYDGQIPAVDILEYERRVNLYLMFRRLNDMYRFGVVDPKWQTTSVAFREPGTILPITITEIRSNPQVSG